MPRSTFYSCSSRLPQSTDYSYICIYDIVKKYKWIYINVNKYNDKLAMLLFLLICQWSVCKIVCNFQHYFGGRSKRESSCLEIRSSARFLREIWISYFARRILEGVFVGGIINIRNECLFFSVHWKWIAVRNKQIAWTAIFFLCSWEMNRSAEQTNRVNCALFFSFHGKWIAVHAICLFRTAIHYPWTEKKRHSFL